MNQDAWGYITGETEMLARDFEVLKGLYRGELSYLDTRIDGLVSTLSNLGMRNDTVVIITSDHGENIGDHSLMDHQYSLFETLLHVPLIICGPGFDDGTVVEQPVTLTDLYPTILDIAGAEPAPVGPMGQSLSDYRNLGDKRPIFAEYLGPQPAFETLVKRYDVKSDVTKYDRRLRSVRRDGYKYISGSDGVEWLFDLESDPDEERNLVGQDIGRQGELWARLDSWVDSLPPVEEHDVDIDRTTQDRLEDLGYLQ